MERNEIKLGGMIVDVGCVVEVRQVKRIYRRKAHNMALVKGRRLVFSLRSELKKFTRWPAIDNVSPCYCCSAQSLLTLLTLLTKFLIDCNNPIQPGLSYCMHLSPRFALLPARKVLPPPVLMFGVEW